MVGNVYRASLHVRCQRSEGGSRSGGGCLRRAEKAATDDRCCTITAELCQTARDRQGRLKLRYGLLFETYIATSLSIRGLPQRAAPSVIQSVLGDP